MIEYTCGGCGQKMHIGEEHAGKQAKCPRCGAVANIPYVSQPAPGQEMPQAMVAPAPDKGQATAALVMGICSVIIPGLGVIFAILGIIFGILAIQKKRGGRGMAITGLVLSIVGLLFVPAMMVAILVPTVGRAREMARQAACQSSLSAVGKGLVMYSALSSDEYPMPLIKKYGDPNVAPNYGNTVNTDAAIFSGTLGDNGMQNVWPMVKENLVSPDHFRCPSDGGWMKRSSANKYGWGDLREFSYGIQWPYLAVNSKMPTTSPAVPSDPNGNPGLVIFADRHPATAGNMAYTGPSNHTRDGQAVLHRDSTVLFYRNFQSPYNGGDDIYTNASGQPGGIPQNNGDTSITPMPSR